MHPISHPPTVQDFGQKAFDFNGADVRIVFGDDGEPLWIASDVAKILGYSTTAAMTRSIRDRNKGVHSLHTPGGQQEMATITEPGLYQAVLKSRRPEAEAFQDWVTDVVLPSIRKHGGYLTPAKVEEALLDPDTIIQLATNLKAERARRATLESRVEAIEPKAEAYDAFMDADGAYSVGTVAKMLGWGQNRLFRELRNAGIFIAKGHMYNTPRQPYMHHFDVTGYRYERKDGGSGVSYTTRIQPSGVDFIRRKLNLAQAQLDLGNQGMAA